MTKKNHKPIRKKFLIFGSPRIEEAEINEVVATLRSGWLSTGPKVARFEDMFRKYMGTRYAMALHSCTAGLHLAMIVSGLGQGDEIITTPMTFAATANVITHIGAEPVYKGQRVGNIGDMTVFSFYVTKNVCTGEGGMVTTNNKDWAEKVQMYGLHGMSKGAWRRCSDK